MLSFTTPPCFCSYTPQIHGGGDEAVPRRDSRGQGVSTAGDANAAIPHRQVEGGVVQYNTKERPNIMLETNPFKSSPPICLATKLLGIRVGGLPGMM